MSLPRDGLIVSLALAVAATLYLFAFRDLAGSGSPAASGPSAIVVADRTG
jgi:hypothetical protein